MVDHADGPRLSGPSTADRRSVLRAGAGLSALVAAGPLAGCFGAPTGDGAGEPDGTATRTFPVDDRLDLLPGDLSMVTYTHVDALIADPVYSRFLDAYLTASFTGFDGGPTSMDALRETWNGTLPMAFADLHEMASATAIGPGLFGGIYVAWTDWAQDVVFEAGRAHLPGDSIERQTHAGSPMLVPRFEEDDHLADFAFALGSLGDGRFAIGTVQLVERVHEVAAGQTSPVGGTLREGMLTAPDGPVQLAVVPPDDPGVAGDESDSGGSGATGSARDSGEAMDGDGATTTEPPPATPPPTPSPSEGTPMDEERLLDLLSHAYGGVYAEGDRRGLALTVVAADAGAAESLADEAAAVLDEWREGPASNPLQPAIADTTVSRDGTLVTVRYEAARDQLEALASAIEAAGGRRTTRTTLDPEPTRGFELLAASGGVEDGAIGAVRLVVRPTADTTPVDLREVFVRFVGPDLPEYDYAFFHPDREVPEMEDFGRFGVKVLGGEAPVLDAADQAAVLRFDLGDDTPEDGLQPFGDAFQPGTDLTAVLGAGDGVTSFPLVVPESLDQDSVSLEP